MFDRFKKKLNLNTDQVPAHRHEVPDEAVERACQILAVYLSGQPADELEVELQNLSCEHEKIGSFKINVTKI